MGLTMMPLIDINDIASLLTIVSASGIQTCEDCMIVFRLT